MLLDPSPPSALDLVQQTWRARFDTGFEQTWHDALAAGDASNRLLAAGLVSPINPALITGCNDITPQLQSPPHNTINGVHYGVSYQWGANILMYNTGVVKPAPDSWSVIFDGTSYSGKVDAYDSPIYIADAALYLKSAQPDLKITRDVVDVSLGTREDGLWVTQQDVDLAGKISDIARRQGLIPATRKLLARTGISLADVGAVGLGCGGPARTWLLRTICPSTRRRCGKYMRTERRRKRAESGSMVKWLGWPPHFVHSRPPIPASAVATTHQVERRPQDCVREGSCGCK